MGSFKIEGGRRLKGEVVPQGAKNEALQILCAVLLTSEPVTIHNVPDIVDVNKLIDLLRHMGVVVEKLGEGSFRFTAKTVDIEFFLKPEFKQLGGGLRGSVMVVGPSLARFGKGYIPTPGGDKIGRRRLDTHFIGFEKLGAEFKYDVKEAFFRVEAKQLKGAYMLLDEASVTGTANIVMAAVLAEGRTTIFNAACEPYLQQLCNMLVRMGAKIQGIGSNLLHIDGVKELGGTEHRMLPDMIEIGSFIGLAAMTRSEITIKDTGYDHLGVIPEVFRKLGIAVVRNGDDIFVPAQEHYTITKFIDGSNMTVSDAPWPGFTPDLLSIVLVTATQAKGSLLVHQKMFESRLFFTDKLIEMGAQITLCDPHRALVIGNDFQSPLRAIRMTSPDIRAGVSLLIAALSADGTSTIDNIEQIDRGYQRIAERLNALGARIERVE
ncbi:MAG: UDP-N-acetylglucosamine 1-carboxyvinyltransferase [Flavobacteriales bacterium]|nr:UDP-N-acetylglucosamine 1-carboxyvinyltransferase [Flavobacteriales bacterium]MBL0043680.1 UDP-N-acetylglucosamine 1-carboxyvinyltransferase [Flavobacteriales bacterium]